jgi:Tol biopolymer transport system component
VDRRTDIWSFGCVVFECLTARQTFAGETVSDIVANILQSEPAWSALPASTPERLRGLLRRCLEKDVKRRQRDIGDARIELEDLQRLRDSDRVARVEAASRGPRAIRWWAAVAIAAVAGGAATWFAAGMWNAAQPARPARFEIPGPKHREILPDVSSVSLSPDGQWIAMIAVDSSSFTPSIWIRRLDSVTPRELPGTRNASIMFWSPDSRYLAFFAGDHLLSKIAISGGDPERICEVKSARGGAWNRDGVILLAPYSNGGIYRVSASGGEPVAITRPDSARGETGYRFPQFLPDGKHFLFTSVPQGADGKFGLYVGSLDGGPPQPLERVESGAIYRDPGWLLMTRDNAVVARRFDARSRRLRGDPVKLGDAPSGLGQYSGGPSLTASETGALGYLTRVLTTQRLVWVDLAGHEIEIPGFAAGLYFDCAVSPDGRHALLGGVTDDLKGYVALADLERGTVSRLTPPTEDAGNETWSPDSRRIAYLIKSNELVVRSLQDGSTRRLLASDHAYKRLDGWSRDGRYLLIERLDATTKWDVWLVPVDGDSTPRSAVRSPANDQQASLSPDGRWIAFSSDETGVGEIYVQAVGSAGLKYQVTTGGGATWFWSRDGKSLVFQRSDRPNNLLFRAAVQGSGEFSMGPPAAFMHFPEGFSYASPAPDEKRFLVLRPAEKPERQTITVLQNWQAALRTP